MNVLLINTSDNAGGAAVACQRLMEALTRYGINARMLVRDKATNDERIVRLGAPWQKAVERVALLPFVGFSWRKSWSIDTNWLGGDITQSEAFRWADVIHLHWVNQGFLALGELERIVRSGKRIVWTMHDAWCATGGCHLTLDCKKYVDGCQGCHLVNRQVFDIVSHTWQQKRRIYEHSQIHFTTCSAWLRNCALESALMKDQQVSVIPNAIDTKVFFRRDKTTARKQLNVAQDKKLILFVSQYVSNPLKGFSYLLDALRKLLEEKNTPPIGIMILGNRGEDIQGLFPEIPVFNLGYQTSPEKIATIYAAADVFVLPSLSENLPNTIMEAMACGVPSVAFHVGGIPEMIDHRQNGYLAEMRNADDLAEGITYCLDNKHAQRLGEACLEKVQKTYLPQIVAQQFISLYKQ